MPESAINSTPSKGDESEDDSGTVNNLGFASHSPWDLHGNSRMIRRGRPKFAGMLLGVLVMPALARPGQQFLEEPP